MPTIFTAAPPEDPVIHALDRTLAKPMFVVSLAFLLCLAGLLHLDSGPAPSRAVSVCEWGLLLLYPLYLIELAAHLMAGNRNWKQNVLFCVIPPLRLGARDHVQGGCLWLPWIGWTSADRDLLNRMEKALSVPMIVMALLVLPLMLLEWSWSERISDEARDAYHRHMSRGTAALAAESSSTEQAASEAEALRIARLYNPHLAMFIQSGTAVIWLAFTLEFIVMISIVDHKLRYCKQHSIDLAVILLPLAAFLRVARLGRLLRLQQLSKTARMYRIRGLLLKAYRAVLVLEVFDRLTRGGPEARLTRLREALAEKESDVAALRKEISELEESLDLLNGPRQKAA